MFDRRIRSEILINTGFAVANAVGVLLSYSIAARLLSTVALDALLLGRRLVSAGANLAQLGVSQTLQRYLSVHAGDERRKCAYLQQAMLIVLVISVATSVLGVVAKDELATLIAVNVADGPRFCWWLVFTITATALCFLSTSLLLAERKVFAAGTLQFLNINGLFLLGLWWSTDRADVTLIFKVLGLGTFVLSALVSAWYLYAWRRHVFQTSRYAHRRIAQDFVGFGLPRTLTCFLDAGIILVGPWMLRTHPGQTTAFLVALTVLRLTQAMLAPISQVLGLGAARSLGAEHDGQRSLQTRRLFGGLCYLGLLTPCLLAPWSKTLVRLWLADEELVASVDYYLQALVWATPALTVFYGLRGVVDMRWTFPFNLVALIISLVTQLLLYLTTYPFLGVPAAALLAVAVGLWVLGIVTTCWIRKDLKEWQRIGLLPLALLGFTVWLINFLLASSPTVASAIAAAVLTAACTYASVKLAPPEFAGHILSKRSCRRAPAGILPDAGSSGSTSEATA